jgi:hypothetical protein
MGKRKRPRHKRVLETPKAPVAYEALAHELAEEFKDNKQSYYTLTAGVRKKLKKHINYRPTPITWGIPLDEVLFSRFFTRFLPLGIMPWDSFVTTESTYLPKARNILHNGFLDMDTDYMMMLDSDILCPPRIVTDLLMHDKHLVGGWYKNKSGDAGPHPVVYDFVSETEERLNFKHRKHPGKGLEKVAGMGAGCWLMSRELAEALGEDPYSLEKATEDFVLCKKIADLGYEIFVDWDLDCAHVGVGHV